MKTKKKKDFLVTQQQTFGAMGHRALLKHAHSPVLYKLFPLFIVCLMLLALQNASEQLSINTVDSR